MVITVEISMYPFRENYREVIAEFVSRLKGYEELRITTGITSSVIIGEYGRVMEGLTEALRWSYDEHGRAVFVAKLLPGYDPE